MITYAQNFEDVLLARVFRGRTDGFYVDVGAGDPIELSVTKWFYDLGWSGNGRHIDFLKIDVEGWKREVLVGLDLRRYRPTVILVEATLPTTRIETHSRWEGLLTRSEYSAVHFDGLSRFYLPSERMDLEIHFQLPPNAFDDFKPWKQAASENLLDTFRTEAATLSRAFADMPPGAAGRDGPGRGSALSDTMMDVNGLDAIRKATRTLSEPGRLLSHALKAGTRSLRRRLSRRDGLNLGIRADDRRTKVATDRGALLAGGS
jgi:hypothetical protein